MIEMTLKNLIVGGGPIPSAIILAPASADEGETGDAETSDMALPINVGSVDAANVARAVESEEAKRPTTHMLLGDTVAALGATLESISITRVEGATFYATLDITSATGETHHIDARPSDAIALAITADRPMFATREVLDCAGTPDFDAIAREERTREEAEFHDFVEGLSPDDFKAPKQG